MWSACIVCSIIWVCTHPEAPAHAHRIHMEYIPIACTHVRAPSLLHTIFRLILKRPDIATKEWGLEAQSTLILSSCCFTLVLKNQGPYPDVYSLPLTHLAPIVSSSTPGEVLPCGTSLGCVCVCSVWWLALNAAFRPFVSHQEGVRTWSSHADSPPISPGLWWWG